MYTNQKCIEVSGCSWKKAAFFDVKEDEMHFFVNDVQHWLIIKCVRQLLLVLLGLSHAVGIVYRICNI